MTNLKIKDVYNITAHQTQVTIIIFWGFREPEKILITNDNIERYGNFKASCIVPTGKSSIMIESY